MGNVNGRKLRNTLGDAAGGEVTDVVEKGAVLASTFLLYSVGLGAGAIPTAGAINWVLKDGLGQLGSLLFGKTIAHNFDVNTKTWYLPSLLWQNFVPPLFWRSLVPSLPSLAELRNPPPMAKPGAFAPSSGRTSYPTSFGKPGTFAPSSGKIICHLAPATAFLSYMLKFRLSQLLSNKFSLIPVLTNMPIILTKAFKRYVGNTECMQCCEGLRMASVRIGPKRTFTTLGLIMKDIRGLKDLGNPSIPIRSELLNVLVSSRFVMWMPVGSVLNLGGQKYSEWACNDLLATWIARITFPRT